MQRDKQKERLTGSQSAVQQNSNAQAANVSIPSQCTGVVTNVATSTGPHNSNSGGNPLPSRPQRLHGMEALSPSKPKPQLLALHLNPSTGASWVLLGHVSTQGRQSEREKACVPCGRCPMAGCCCIALHTLQCRVRLVAAL